MIDGKFNIPLNGVVIVDQQFNTDIGIVLVEGSGSVEQDKSLAQRGVAGLAISQITTNPSDQQHDYN